MRLFAATLATETNTYSPLPTSLEAYKESVFFRPGEHPHDSLPSSVYGVPLLMSALAYGILQRTMEGAGSTQINDARIVRKSWISRALYAAGIGLAFVRPWISQLCYAAVAIMWMIPDRRVEMDHAGST